MFGIKLPEIILIFEARCDLERKKIYGTISNCLIKNTKALAFLPRVKGYKLLDSNTVSSSIMLHEQHVDTMIQSEHNQIYPMETLVFSIYGNARAVTIDNDPYWPLRL